MSSMKGAIRITQRRVNDLLKSVHWSEVWDSELKGFHIRKTSKSASYRLHYRDPITRKHHILTLGKADLISLPEARQAAEMTVSRLATSAMKHKVEQVNNQYEIASQHP